MKFSRIFKETKLFWPSTIEISDGEQRDDGSAIFPCLVHAWEKAEISAEKWSELHQLMVWAIYGGLHRLAKNEYANGASKIEKSNIDVKYVENKFSENLFTKIEPMYPKQYRNIYKNDLE